MTVIVKSGISRVGTLTQGVDGPFYARGAIKTIKLILPADEEPMEFGLFDRQSGALLGQSENGILDVVKHVDSALRVKSFEQTQLPYAEHGITADQYYNLSSVARVNLTLERLSEKNAQFFFDVEWVQLFDADTQEPLVRNVYNLVAGDKTEPKYVPLVKYDFAKELAGKVPVGDSA